MTYEQKLRQRAEVMAAIFHATTKADKDCSIQDANYWEIKINSYLPHAQLSLQHEAQSFKDAWRIRGHAGTSFEVRDAYLEELGLIPDLVNAAGSDTGESCPK